MYNSNGVFGDSIINNYLLFYSSAILAAISIILISNIICNKFRSNLLINRTLIYFKYLSLNLPQILGSHIYYYCCKSIANIF